MKLLFNIRMLSLICIVLSIGMTTSCNKNNDTGSGSSKVVLQSFGPTGARHGDTISFIGNNLNKVTAIKFMGDSVARTAFVSQTAEVIKLVVTTATESGLVTLKTPDGDVISKTILNLEVVVTVKTITASARPGDSIIITGQYMDWVTSVTFAKGVMVTKFLSQTLNKLVVAVPMNAQTGTLFISYGGTLPKTFETDSILKVTLPVITGLATLPLIRGQNLTITGTNLDLTQGVFFKGIALADTVFVSKSATQLVILVPAAANKGTILLQAYSLLTTESPMKLMFVGDLPDLAPLGYAFYDDKLENNWQNWGWGATIDFANADNVRDGAAAIKCQYTGQWSALKFANGSIVTAPYTQVAFSIFGTPGTGGKKIDINAGGASFTITIVEGQWIEYKLTMANLGSPAAITNLVFQNEDWVGTLYIDQVGLR